jgi:hypothetical protein
VKRKTSAMGIQTGCSQLCSLRNEKMIKECTNLCVPLFFTQKSQVFCILKYKML